MFNIGKYLKAGLKNTLLLRNNSGVSHNGPWVQVIGTTLLDRWHVGDFSTAEYTISADLDVNNKEIIKVLVTATVEKAAIVIYARNYTTRELIDVSATVNASYVDLILTPSTSSSLNSGVKVIYSVNYFHNQNPPTA
jgi:hypothetical protein